MCLSGRATWIQRDKMSAPGCGQWLGPFLFSLDIAMQIDVDWCMGHFYAYAYSCTSRSIPVASAVVTTADTLRRRSLVPYHRQDESESAQPRHSPAPNVWCLFTSSNNTFAKQTILRILLTIEHITNDVFYIFLWRSILRQLLWFCLPFLDKHNIFSLFIQDAEPFDHNKI